MIEPKTKQFFTPAELTWDNNTPIASNFGDHYFRPPNSQGNGWDESCHNFLVGNNLAERFADPALKHFTIAETGFGTGLNLLTSWDLWEKLAPKDAHLDFISVELHPLLPEDLAKALAQFDSQAAQNIATLKAAYPPLLPAWHRRHLAPNVTLTLIFGDVLEAYTQLHGQIDAWFLDGFTPARNAAMWQPALFAAMANLSHAGTSLGSFTAAGFVRQGLKDVGFDVQKTAGFGHKFDCIKGQFLSAKQKTFKQPQTVSIVGAGLAGASVAYALKRRGVACQIFDAATGVGQGASGNDWGLVNPKIHALPDLYTSFGSACYSFAPHILSQLDLWQAQPSLYLANNVPEQQRQQKLLQLGWHTTHMQAHPDGLLFPSAGLTQPKKLVEKLLGDQMVQWQTSAPQHAGLQIDTTGQGLLSYNLPLQPVRGQVTYGTTIQSLPTHTTMFGHYAMPLPHGLISVGASFKRGDNNTALNPQDDADNLEAAKTMLGLEITPQKSWAGVRVAAKDYLPIAGPYKPTHYILGALGSHGIQYALLLGELLAAQISGAPWPLPKNVVAKLCPQRFHKEK